MNNTFTCESILLIADLLNDNKLDFDTKFTTDEWSVYYRDESRNVVRLDNLAVGQFLFQRIRGTSEYCLLNSTCKTCATRTWKNLTEFMDDVIEEPQLLDNF